jgi:tRNA threonylcarbamoyladenosine biosynthesis protein TsaE
LAMNDFRLEFNEDKIVLSARQFLANSQGKRHFAFYGPMGVGKTTFIKALCNELGTSDLVSSPSFAIINEYATFEKIPIYHFDFYRIKSAVELLDIGFDEYCRDDAYCFIEWPEKGEELLSDDFIKVTLAEKPDGSRMLCL